MYVAVTIIAALIAVCAILILRCIDLYTAKFDGMYVDSGGVRSIPPEYIDVVKRKTMNVKLDAEFTISIPQVSFIDAVYRIREIQAIFYLLKQESERKDALVVNEKNLKQFLTFAHALCVLVYSLSYTFIKRGKRKAYFKAMKKRMINDIEWTCELLEQMLDFWAYIKKKVSYLAKGSTPRQMYGDNFSWDYLGIGSDGSTYLLPRYGKPLSTTDNAAKTARLRN